MSRRVDRVNELLRHEISRLLTLQTKDPRLRAVITVTRVDTGRDLQEAQVFISVMGDAVTKKSALEGIRSAAAYLRRELRPRLNLRYTPFLKFDLDDSLEEANHILGIMNHILETQPDRPVLDEGDSYVGPLTFPGSNG